VTSAGDGSGRTRVLGIDVGSVRIGLAITDETCTLASPVATLANEPHSCGHASSARSKIARWTEW